MKGWCFINHLQIYVNDFFSKLEVFKDVSREHCYKTFMRAVLEFLENETKESAFAVYEAFFDSYRITLEGESNPFIDLLDILRSYEENAATLIEKQEGSLHPLRKCLRTGFVHLFAKLQLPCSI